MKGSKKRFHIIFIAILLVFLLVFGFSAVRAMKTDTISAGVSAGGVRLDGLTEEEAFEKLRLALNETSFETPIHLSFGDVEKTVVPAEFLAAYDYAETAKAARAYCHEGGFFRRVAQAARTLLFPKSIPMEISYDEAAYDEILDSLMDGLREKVQEHTWEIEDETLVVTTGRPGLMPDKNAVSASILNTIRLSSYEDKIVFKKESRNPAPLTADFLFKNVCSEAKDASYVIEDGKVIMHPHVLGISFDKSDAQAIIDDHTGYGVQFKIPLRIQEPEVLLADIEEKLFSEVIGEYSTKFNAGDVSRSKNIALASNKINGTILAPDEIFSYNDVVGERSYSEGFEAAGVYVNGETVQGLGGGICQVSSTLFNAVVLANLDIVERVNHQLTVSYVPLGRDATVDYGNIDFRFKNTTGYPIKITCTAEGGKMYVGINGYKEDKDVTISFETVTIGHTPPPERKVDDPTLPKGEEKVEKEGTSGYIVDTYKVITRKGEEAEKIYLCRSNYNGNFRIVHVGTGEEVPSPSPTETIVPTESAQPTETETPVPTTSIQTPIPSAEVKPTPTPDLSPSTSPERISDTGL